MKKLASRVKGLFKKGQKGQALVEYALILVLIAIVVLAVLTGLGGNVNNTISKVNSAMEK